MDLRVRIPDLGSKEFLDARNGRNWKKTESFKFVNGGSVSGEN